MLLSMTDPTISTRTALREILTRSTAKMEVELNVFTTKVLRTLQSELRDTLGAEIEKRSDTTDRYGEIALEEIAKELASEDGYPRSDGMSYNHRWQADSEQLKVVISSCPYTGTDLEDLKERISLGNHQERLLDKLPLYPDEYLVYFGYRLCEQTYHEPNSGPNGTRMTSRLTPFLITNYCNLYYLHKSRSIHGAWSNDRWMFRYEQNSPNIRLNDLLIQLLQSIPSVLVRGQIWIPPWFRQSWCVRTLEIDQPVNGQCSLPDHPAIHFHRTLSLLLPEYWGSTGLGSYSLGMARERMLHNEREATVAELRDQLSQKDQQIGQLEKTVADMQKQLDELDLFRRCMAQMKESCSSSTE